jgi:anti-anti-sigma factor
MRVSDLSIVVDTRAARTTIRCSGELDVSTCKDLRDAVTRAVAQRPSLLQLDCSGISLLTAAGIKCLVEAELVCREKDVPLEMSLSPEARKVLDVVGLWWLGVVKDGIAVEIALEQALRRYGNRGLDGTPDAVEEEPRL